MALCPIAPYIYQFSLLLSGTSCRTFYDGVRQLRGVSLYLDTQGEFALPARDFSVAASISGWYNWLQQSRLAAPGCPACTSGGTPQPQGMYTYRLEARVARFYAAWPALRGFRSSGGPSASVARFPPIGVIVPADRNDLFGRFRFCVGSPPQFSRELGVAPAAAGHTPEFVFSDFRPSSSLVGRVCVARTRLRVDLRDSSGRQAGVRFLRRLPAAVLTGTWCHTGRNRKYLFLPHWTYFVLC